MHRLMILLWVLLLNANERNIKLRVKIKISMVNPLKPPIFVINLYTVSPVESDSEIEGIFKTENQEIYS